MIKFLNIINLIKEFLMYFNILNTIYLDSNVMKKNIILPLIIQNLPKFYSLLF